MKRSFFLFLALGLLLAACSRPYDTNQPFMPVLPTYNPGPDTHPTTSSSLPIIVQPGNAQGEYQSATLTPFQPPTRQPGVSIPTPTPDPPKAVPTLRTKEEKYTVQANDTLGAIARRYGVDVSTIAEANKLTDPNRLKVGQVLVIPAPSVRSRGSSLKIIPDSELILGPRTAGFALDAFIVNQKGYLARYVETVDSRSYSGAQIVERIAVEYSVNPRLLLAVLEYQSGWVTRSDPPDARMEYPLGKVTSYRKGLYRQLAWGADMLNRGYYLWRVDAISSWQLADGSIVPVSPELNAGTAGVQHFFSQLYDRDGWDQAVSEKGLFAVYTRFFGHPFDYAVEPVLPANLAQPKMQLPFEPGATWSFTGGPHGGWGEGSAWAALDFAPPGEGGGCRQSSAWVVAVADGVIIHSDLGAVIQDLDGDGDERTGWSILYMHIETEDRVNVGKRLKAGDRIGHPSCEGGVSNGTHMHIARRYNGEWIPADGPLPFNLDGWISEGAGVEYYGYLHRGGVTLEAWETKTQTNQIER